MPRDKFYDGKRLFQEYCKWGKAASNNRLIEWAAANMPNPDTGKSSQMGPYYAMWSWAFDNPRESYELWKQLQFDRRPDEPIPTFEEYTILLRNKAANNINIAGKGELQRFCLRYGLPAKVNVKPRDVVQVVRPNHFLFQRFLTVTNVDPVEGFVEAWIFNPDGTTTNHQLKVTEVGVVGKTIIS